MRLLALFILAISTGIAASETRLPCSIEQIQSTPGGIAIRFSEKMFWYYEDSLGNYGVIGVGGVKQFVVLANGREDVLPSQPLLHLKRGASLKLSEHHAGCQIEFGDQGSTLKIRRSFSYLGSSKVEEHVVNYQ